MGFLQIFPSTNIHSDMVQPGVFNSVDLTKDPAVYPEKTVINVM